MKKELDEYLVKKYPKIFVDRYASIQQSCMAFGFEHSDGWFWLIDQLCNSIQSYIDNNNKYRSEDKQISQVIATQVKEKFGTLRFYYDGGDEYISGMVSLAENMSGDICEFCGSTKNVGYTKGWVSTICEDCLKKNEKNVNRVWVRNDNYLDKLASRDNDETQNAINSDL